MAKPKGRKPAKDSKLPDPKIWKWCKHPDCMKKARQLQGFGGENEQGLMKEHPDLCAIFLEDYCWNHLSGSTRAAYKGKVEAWIAKGWPLENANLQDTILENANLQEANLQAANLWNANLQEVNLCDANLQKTFLLHANLQEALLIGANLQGAYLAGANLQSACLDSTNLQKATLWGANLQGANFRGSKLHGCNMNGSQLEYVSDLTWQQIEYVGEEKDKGWWGAQEAYRLLKNYFHQQGQYQDEGQAYYREKLMTQRLAWKEKKLGKWFVLFLLNILAGFGEKLWRTVVGAFATILIFSGIYWLAGKLVANGGEPITKFWHCLYFSVVTFATLGFGDISPALYSTGTQVAAVIEVILGYVFLGMLITIIARKFGR